jgi:hypothetical protein
MKFWTVKQSGKLIPADVEDQIAMNKLPVGEPLLIKYVQVRNGKHHRKYFKFMAVVYENLPEHLEGNYPTVDSFRKAMEMYAGHFVETITLRGERQLQPKSIKYEELDEMAFSDLHNGVKNVIGKWILKDVDMDIFEKEIERFYM